MIHFDVFFRSKCEIFGKKEGKMFLCTRAIWILKLPRRTVGSFSDGNGFSGYNDAKLGEHGSSGNFRV